jgi:hypothetical protein
MPQIVYIVVGIVTLAIIAAIFIVNRKKPQKPLSPLAGLAFAFIIAGVIFGDDRLIGYSLMGIGIILAIIDIIKNKKAT